MGRCSLTEVFDPVAKEILKLTTIKDRIKKTKTLRQEIAKLETALEIIGKYDLEHFTLEEAIEELENRME